LSERKLLAVGFRLADELALSLAVCHVLIDELTEALGATELTGAASLVGTDATED
jgi:hypothetical protein